MTAVLVATAVVLAATIAGVIRARARRLPRVTEWQARKNAAPLSSAILIKHVADRDRGET